MRYLRLYFTFLRYGLMQEMAFRANFLVRVATELIWFVLLVVFYDVVYAKTQNIAGWTKYQYLLLVGTHFLVTGLIETFVMPNCAELAELVRTGRLDFALAKPVDEQFLLTLQAVDWAAGSNVLYGLGMVGYSLWDLGRMPTAVECLLFLVTMTAGTVVFYSLMISLAVSAVWLVRNQTIYEQWFYVNMFARYPPELFSGPWARPLRGVLTYGIPVLIVVSVPARVLTSGLGEQPWLVVLLIAMAVVSFGLSRWTFKRVLRGYRGASA
jgi:ABC-2 type transport system permease protein